MLWTLLLAAGASSRMRGGDKLLEQVAGQPLLRRQAEAAMSVGPVMVALPPERPERRAALAGLNLQVATVANASEGMGASIRAGVAALPAEATAVMILPGDMPDLDAAALRTMKSAQQAAPDHIWRGASADGTPGHPVIFPRRTFVDLAALEGDTGARSVLRSEAPRLVRLSGEAALTDLDTPEAWAAWRRKP
jgi:CTP:molybdopterin cytidylyltransferase MocA